MYKDGQTSQDPVNKVVPGTLGTGLNPFILFLQERRKPNECGVSVITLL